MKMVERRRWWVVMTMGLLLGTSWAVNVSRTFKLLYRGEQMINSIYTSYPRSSMVMCATTCLSLPECWVYTWDNISNECQLLNGLTEEVTLIPAPLSLNTYYVAGENNHLIHMTRSFNWENCKTACEELGGRLAIPQDTTFSLIYHHVYKINSFFIGMWRQEDNTTVWYDVDNEVVKRHPQWASGYPKNEINRTVTLVSRGLLKDRNKNEMRRAFCVV
ncbi:putative Lectin C-type domain-containing protein 2 [Homarus americanus]|uniref:Putative Lectin C-type domain-containing protein 2 n=1 Tax=Homarus americanus TaxID=6706 RepID=A0A8J5T3V4_HOMAM|nr:putative Lectin C-type domain-containing protein 2 [Homarus americanus]